MINIINTQMKKSSKKQRWKFIYLFIDRYCYWNLMHLVQHWTLDQPKKMVNIK